MLLQWDNLRVCTRTGRSVLPWAEGLIATRELFLLAVLQALLWGGVLETVGHLCQGWGLACAPCSDSRSVCSVIPSAMGAETKRPVRHSLSLLLCPPIPYNPVT